jgi:hypothetical protein
LLPAVGAEIIPSERIESQIYLLRGQKVLLDRDLAELYGVETRVLNQTVGRNSERFPEDFMFSLTRDEIRNLSQIPACSIRHEPSPSTSASCAPSSACGR